MLQKTLVFMIQVFFVTALLGEKLADYEYSQWPSVFVEYRDMECRCIQELSGKFRV
ncbi:hypothetical protein Hdeb2414_s0485g00903011 [Helianthus debilis subsp. tardiflorus]